MTIDDTTQAYPVSYSVMFLFYCMFFI